MRSRRPFRHYRGYEAINRDLSFFTGRDSMFWLGSRLFSDELARARRLDDVGGRHPGCSARAGFR